MTAKWDETYDVVVVGSGAAGLTAALVAADRGARTIVLEKASRVGGTTRKSAGVFWILNNRFLQDAGVTEDRESSLRYMAKQSRPGLYDPDHPTLGLPAWEYEALDAFYAHGMEAVDALERMGAVELGWNPDYADYFGYLPEAPHDRGHAIFPAEAAGGQIGGQMLVDGFVKRALDLGVTIRTDEPVVDLVLAEDGSVLGVESAGDRRGRIRALRGVVFASGGFTHNKDLRDTYLDRPYIGGCAAPTNTGDFVGLAQKAGATLANMQHPWRAPIVVERLQRDPETVAGTFLVAGNAMLWVNRDGRRVFNEKWLYNETTRLLFDWDVRQLSYPNIPMIMIWDRTSAERAHGVDFGNPIPPPEVDGYWVVEAPDLPALTEAIRARLQGLDVLGAQRELAPDFLGNLQATIARYNELAASGVDEDFHRGETAIERMMGTFTGEGSGPNPLMDPIAAEGPYYATILAPGTLDTKGGPRVDLQGRVLRADGSVVLGLYGAGNCVASPSAEAYWGPGSTLGPIITYAYLTGLGVAARVAEGVA